jgi:hypothetical protein
MLTMVGTLKVRCRLHLHSLGPSDHAHGPLRRQRLFADHEARTAVMYVDDNGRAVNRCRRTGRGVITAAFKAARVTGENDLPNSTSQAGHTMARLMSAGDWRLNIGNAVRPRRAGGRAEWGIVVAKIEEPPQAPGDTRRCPETTP